MENIFKISKRGIIATLALCILLSIAGTCVNVAAMAEEITLATETTAVATEEITTVVVVETTIPKYEPTVATGETTVVIEETTQELVPRMATRCGRTYGLGGYTVVTGEIPDSSGHNQYGPCTYTIYYYGDGSSYGIYTDNRGTQHVQTYSDGSHRNSWWG